MRIKRADRIGSHIFLLLLSSVAWNVAASATEDPCGESVLVEAGDTLAGIAERCDVNLNSLLRANPQLPNPNLVQPGTPLNVPDRRIAEAEEHSRVVARPGETLADIATHLDIPLAYLQAVNPHVEPGELEPGAIVVLPPDK